MGMEFGINFIDVQMLKLNNLKTKSTEFLSNEKLEVIFLPLTFLHSRITAEDGF